MANLTCNESQSSRESHFDPESSVGFDQSSNGIRACKSKESKAGGSADPTAKISQSLLKGDRVFALIKDPTGWNYLSKDRSQSYRSQTGTVVLRKEWKDSNLTLYIRWENGKFEKLRGASDHIAYADKVYVLDRECIAAGSKVILSESPKTEGKVVNKRYVVTASNYESPEFVFEDIDAQKFTRHSFGIAYKGNKILYEGWLGLSSDYRVKVYFKCLCDEEVETHSFSVLLDSNQAADFSVGQKITLTMKLLWAAGTSGELGANWFVKFFRYYNTSAIVAAIEIEELLVNWICRAKNPAAEPNPFDTTDAPEQIIRHDDFINVHYLTGDTYGWMIKDSLWKYNADLDSAHCKETNHPITKTQWLSKWLKNLDWDRWEYPIEPKVMDDKHYLKSGKVLKVMYTRVIFDVIWDDETLTTVDAGDIIPIHAGSVWSDMLRFQRGTVVFDRVKHAKSGTYGVIMDILDNQTTAVKWIDTKSEGQPKVRDSIVPLYDLDKKPEYDYLSRLDQYPIVSSCSGLFHIGVVQTINSKSGRVHVKLPNDEIKVVWPHELVHFKSDILWCPIESHWIFWYDHVIPSPGTSQVTPECQDEAKPMEEKITVESLVQKKKVEGFDDVPEDNIFAFEDVIPRVRETHYRRTVENEVVEMQDCLPDGMWIEYYMNRGDIMSTIITGPEDSIFEDFIFVFDLFLLEDFPKSEPHINFRSMGVTILPGHFCKTGAVILPEETRLTENDFTFSYILNLLLEIKDFMAIPLEVTNARDNENLIGVKDEDPLELYKLVLLNLLDYAIALLKKPPKNWAGVILGHYGKAIPKLIEKYKSGKLQMKRSPVVIKNEKGDFSSDNNAEVITIPWEEIYTESVKLRMNELEQIFSTIKYV